MDDTIIVRGIIVVSFIFLYCTVQLQEYFSKCNTEKLVLSAKFSENDHNREGLYLIQISRSNWNWILLNISVREIQVDLI